MKDLPVQQDVQLKTIREQFGIVSGWLGEPGQSPEMKWWCRDQRSKLQRQNNDLRATLGLPMTVLDLTVPGGERIAKFKVKVD